MNIRYRIYNPSGNITALVEGDVFTPEERITINDAIMAAHPEVEQVGFLSAQSPRLTMAGGEFCGNATRCAILYYLERLGAAIPVAETYGKSAGGAAGRKLPAASLRLQTCGAVYEGGVVFGSSTRFENRADLENISDSADGTNRAPAEPPCATDVWVRIGLTEHATGDPSAAAPNNPAALPAYRVRQIDDKTAAVDLPGISFLIKEPSVLAALTKDGADLKTEARRLLADSGLDNDALGVIFLESPNADADISIRPAIRVKAIDTMFLENACGSGSIAAALAQRILRHNSAPAANIPAESNTGGTLTIMQPSGIPLRVSLELRPSDGAATELANEAPSHTRKIDARAFTAAVLCGPIYDDGMVRNLEL